ncbi:hypothetical protein DTO021D3_5871 [Paecilomyces variotii]|nr:hypothetical protein DTO032I3_4988 [Paecilomyces variotii]KAJ9277184.1 hypothetical protein DTO021D3_5871 [Paecilomyces variotii]KAJ9339429.1 hypothetical protein DTO027B6_7997 [Paecilomyces variotii]KAJ9376806.1 hypothetical protein DTO063F5_8594 [Paecilomyces variotii]KAJ9377650.1 hypothetical protein DTO032I4_8004 [Paecilomyces variotii]
MKLAGLFLAALGAIGPVAAHRSPQHVGKKLPRLAEQHVARSVPSPPIAARAEQDSLYLNEKSYKFAVNGANIPDVDWDIGESYAGLLPISDDPKEERQLYFWFFPSDNPLAGDEITIWLNGGPGCSSLEGLLQENGPFLWQYGTFKPVKNPYTWVNLTNMVWVEQPVGTGFSQGTPNATSEEDVAEQFLGFFKNFVDTFNLHGRKVYIAGESYAGYYVPYIANAMFDKENTEYYNIQSIMIFDPSLSSDAIQEQIPTTPFVDYWGHLLSLNESFVENLHSLHKSCGYEDYIKENLVYPPKGKFPEPPSTDGECDLWDSVFAAASDINPCFDVYQVATTCPTLWDVLGFPGSFDYLPAGAKIYFDRPEVQKAINAPKTNWAECTDTEVFVGGTDNSEPSSYSVLPSVIEKANRTIIGHGLLDFILLAQGTRLVIQNMTWNGAQGFSAEPSDDFYVPYHPQASLSTLAGAGTAGTFRTERGLTYAEVKLSGHMIPQYFPTAAYRLAEYLLGRIDTLSENATQPL